MLCTWELAQDLCEKSFSKIVSPGAPRGLRFAQRPKSQTLLNRLAKGKAKVDCITKKEVMEQGNLAAIIGMSRKNMVLPGSLKAPHHE